MPTQAPTGYLFGNGWEHAQRRLRSLERVYDAGTTRRLDALEVGAGWRCLEVGAGGGSIARWLCSRVQPTGRVLAVDLDTRFVADLRAANLDVAPLDVVAEELPRDAFDLVHVRAVLAHLPERAAVLGKLVAALAPGGRLLVEEPYWAASFALASGLHEAMLRRLSTAIADAGFDGAWARELPRLLHEAGLVAVGAETEVPLSAGGSVGAELIQLSQRQIRAELLAAGATARDLDEWDAVLDRPGEWFCGCALLAAWGRRP
ncbi:MAG: methyltransferase [Sporichthyaceae bacterium]